MVSVAQGRGSEGARRLRLTAAIAGGYFGLTLIVVLLIAGRTGIAAIWPANALLFAMLIAGARNRTDVVWFTTGAALACTLAHVVVGTEVWRAAIFGVANAAGGVLALLVCRVRIRDGLDLNRVDHVLIFGVACAVAPVLGASIASLVHLPVPGVSTGAIWMRWYMSTLLGLLIVTPALFVGRELIDQQRRGMGPRHTLAEVMAVLGAVAAAAVAVFTTADKPMLFAVLPLVLLATFRLRTFGAAAATMIVAAVGAWSTARGMGPIAILDGNSVERMLYLQFYLGVTFISALPLAAAIAERDARTAEANDVVERLRTVVENIGEVIFRTDVEGRWTYLNPAWESISGYSIAGSLGESCLAHVEEADRMVMIDRMVPLIEGHVSEIRRVIRFQTAAGPVRWMEVLIQSLTDGDGVVTGTTGTLRDIDARKRLEEDVASAKRRAEEMARQATLLAATDELTGVANRRGFMRQLDREIEAAVELGRPLTTALFDIDFFKRVNDRFGHATGDRILHAVAQRAVRVVRSGDLVGRLGGEEFGILMPGASAEDASLVAERLRDAIEGAHKGEDSLPPVTISIGIAMLEGPVTGAALLAAADGALYAAKDGGRNQVKIAA